MSDPRRLLAAAAIFALLTSACGAARPGVDVRSVQTEIAFGVTAVSADTAPPGFAPPLVLPTPPPENAPPPRTLPGRLRPPPPSLRSDCPEAALTAFPEKQATLEVDSRPDEGRRRWKRSGQAQPTGLPFPFPIEGFETRTVTGVQDSLRADFQFETVQSDEVVGATGLRREIVVTGWQVRSEPVGSGVNVPGTDGVRENDPERGLALTHIERYREDGTLISAFRPQPPVLYLPLPVEPGESWSASGADPATGQALDHQGRVVRRQRVDACGEVVDGWRIESSQTFVGTQTTTRTYDYVVATQLGAILVSEHVKTTSSSGTLDATFEVAQVKPDPVKDGDRP